MTLPHVDTWLASLADRDFAESTLRGYKDDLDLFAKLTEITDPLTATEATFDKFLGKLALRGLAPQSRLKHLVGVKSFFSWLTKRKMIATDPSEEVCGPIARTKQITTFTQDEIRRMIFAKPAPVEFRRKREPKCFFEQRTRCAPLLHARDSAMIGLSYSIGLRAREAASASIESFDPRIGKKGGGTFRAFGKYARAPELMAVDEKISALVMAWLEVRRAAGIPVTGPLFCDVWSKEPGGQLDYASIAHSLKRRMELVRIDAAGRRLSFHALRYSLATHLNDGGMTLVNISKVLRHKSITTTLKYLSLGAGLDIRRKSIGLLPWNRLPGIGEL